MSQLRLFLLGILLNITPMVAHTVKAAGDVQIVTLETNRGTIQIEMLSDDAPETVKNFLNYVNRGDFDGTFFHRSIRGFVLQGGGFSFNAVTRQVAAVVSDLPVVNEFGVSNTRGTVAMAKLDGDPDSATNQWFINLADNNPPNNPLSLDVNNGGFTVFGRVIGNGMDVVDAIAAIPTTDLDNGSTFDDTPTINFTGTLTADTLVTIVSATLDVPAPAPLAFTIDTSATAPINGLWYNPLEEGWGISLTQQTDIIFATIFTFDSEGFPKWYIVSNCAIQGDSCTGEIFSVSNGTSILDPWPIEPGLSITSVGNMSITFTDNNTATMAFDIKGLSATKQIVRQEFSALSPGEAMTGLWFNPLEQGWGVSLTRQTGIAFATMFTYDGNGFPAWYVVSDCTVSGTGCSGVLYEVTSGSALTEDWKPNTSVDSVGRLTFNFSDDDNGTIDIEINGSANSKDIERQVFAVDTDADGISDGKDNCPNIANADQLDVDENGTGDACEP